MSPCIGICQMDDASGYCIGCGRTIEEISGWSTSTPAQQQETLDQLPARPIGSTSNKQAGGSQQ